MLSNRDEYIGKRVKWKELVDLFPNCWIAMSECEWNGGNIVEGNVDAIIRDDEVEDRIHLYLGKSEVCRRTALGDAMGIFGGIVNVEVS